MDDYNESTHVLKTNKYLEIIKNESSKKKRFTILKKFFVENICNNFCQNMDLLNSLQPDFEKYQKIYVLIAKELYLKVLFAAETLIHERREEPDEKYAQSDKKYAQSDKKYAQSDKKYAQSSDFNENTQNEYSICHSYIGPEFIKS